MTKTPGRNRSAACGAWREMDGTHAHTFCTGNVSLPPPDDRCTCPCHGPDIADRDPADD